MNSSQIQRVALAQARGKWVAQVKNTRSAEILGTRYLPVLRDYDNGEWTRGGSPRLYVDVATTKMGPGGSAPSINRSKLLLSKTPVWLRKGQSDGSGGCGTVGRSAGVFSIKRIAIDAEMMDIVLSERRAMVSK